MLFFQLANKYARAIFELALEQNNLDDFDRDLAFVNNELFAIPQVVSFFHNPLVPVSAKKDLISKTLEGEVSATVLNFLFLLSDKSRIAFFPDIYHIFSNLKNDAQGILVADVTTAFPLSKELEKKLGLKLAEVTRKKIKIRRHEDKSILGGIIVSIGDKRIDGSVSGKFLALHNSLSS